MFGLVQFLEAMVGAIGAREVEARVREVVTTQASNRGLTVDKFLDENGVRGLYREKAIKNGVIGVFALAECIRRLGIPLEGLVDTRPAPWDGWQPGSVVAVITGVQQFQVTDQQKGLPRGAVDERDLRGQEYLMNWLGYELKLSYKWERRSVPASLTATEAGGMLADLRKRSDVGAIVVLGSPVVNPVVEPLARRILDNMPEEDLPARFRWGFDLPKRMPRYLSEPGKCNRDPETNQEGIRVRGGRDTTILRLNNRDAFAAFRRGDAGPFTDCGMVLIDCRHRPRLIICAGHGGCGTLACVYALTNSQYISQQLRRSYAQPSWPVGPSRVFEVVWVKRMKPTDQELDDFAFDVKRGNGWGFWLEDPT
jgi:hypothetical protein